MNPDSLLLRERHFVEEMGILFEEMGGQRMMGRVLGRLLICDPPHQSSAELADWLDASRGAISMTTRQLLAAGLIERVGLPADRSTYFRIETRGWMDIMKARMAHLTMVREVAERGLSLMAGKPEELSRRLLDFRDFYAYLERRMPEIIDEWVLELQRRSR